VTEAVSVAVDRSAGRGGSVVRLATSRLASTLAVLLIVSAATFFMLDLLPGSPAQSILGADATAEQVDLLNTKLGLDRPVTVRFFDWMGDVLTGDLGESLQTRGVKVASVVKQRFGVTLELALMAQVMALLMAVPAAMWAAYRAGRAADHALSGVTFALVSVPSFVLAIVFVYLFAIRLGWFPVTGWVRLTDSPWGNFKTAFLPAATLATLEFAVYMRLLRADLIETFQQDYMLAARAQGLGTPRLLAFHALRPSMFSFVTLLGVSLGRLLGGTVVVETFFAIPGLGKYMVDSILRRDVIAVQGVVLVIVVAYVVVNGLVDLAYLYLDPRLRRRS
jgi:peptide/nickel transport system permease protein